MSLYTEWKELIENQTEETFEDFWKEYSETETKIYENLLENYKENLSGKVSDLVDKYECNNIIFAGFLDGINDSLNTALDLDSITMESEIDLDVDFNKLYFNMLKADANYLYTLSQWDAVLTAEEREDILKDYKRSKIYHAEKKPGRNDPCPCGSGKKYKKCCGKNA